MGVSLVKGLQEFFSADGGTKLAIAEFKALTQNDREELREMLIGIGWDIDPLPKK